MAEEQNDQLKQNGEPIFVGNQLDSNLKLNGEQRQIPMKGSLISQILSLNNRLEDLIQKDSDYWNLFWLHAKDYGQPNPEFEWCCMLPFVQVELLDLIADLHLKQGLNLDAYTELTIFDMLLKFNYKVTHELNHLWRYEIIDYFESDEVEDLYYVALNPDFWDIDLEENNAISANPVILNKKS